MLLTWAFNCIVSYCLLCLSHSIGLQRDESWRGWEYFWRRGGMQHQLSGAATTNSSSSSTKWCMQASWASLTSGKSTVATVKHQPLNSECNGHILLKSSLYPMSWVCPVQVSGHAVYMSTVYSITQCHSCWIVFCWLFYVSVLSDEVPFFNLSPHPPPLHRS